ESSVDRIRLLRIARTIRSGAASHANWRPLYREAAAVDLTVAIVSAFAEEVRNDGRRPVILFLPERSFVRDVIEGRPSAGAPLIQRLKALNAPFVDLTPPITDFVRRAQGGLNHFMPHYSPQLSEAVAGYLAEWKKTEKSLE